MMGWRGANMSIARNAPCPCGSDKKYKQCCGQTGAPPPPVLDEHGEPVGRDWKRPAGLVCLAILLGVGTGLLRSDISDGFAVGGASLLLVIGYLVTRTPPSSTGRGGGAAINYGMGNPRSSRRRTGSKKR
jgi:hypothetical protein